jgi:hypothetical protein
MRHYVPAAERTGDVDPQQPLRPHVLRRRRQPRVLHIGEDTHRAVIEGRADLGQVQAAGRTVEQGGAQIRLQGGDVAGDCGDLDALLHGGAGEAAEFHCADEGAHSGEVVHAAMLPEVSPGPACSCSAWPCARPFIPWPQK